MSNIFSSNCPVQFPNKEYASAFLPENGTPFRSAVIGITYPSADYHIERTKFSPVTVFEYVLSGEGKLFLNGEWQTAKAGEVYILRAGEGHRYRADLHDPFRKIWINYVSDYISPMLDAYGLSSGIYPAANARTYFEELLTISEHAAQSPDTCYRIADYVHRILHTVVSARTVGRTDEYRIREALNAAVYEKLNLDSLAERLHLSKSSLIRVFKKNYGVTPYEYLLSLKISAAKLLLKDTKMTVREIANRLCISDEHYFSSLFLSKVGMRPREYREQI